MTNAPLVNTLSVPGGGRIGLTRCPGATGALLPDLRDIVNLGATTLLSLVTNSELTQLRVADLGRQADAHGLHWLHLPIADMQTPGAAFEQHWGPLRDQLLVRLANGELIVVHCRAGLGRAGVVACRLLVDTGMAAGAALALVRATRPGAVETHGQQAWVSGLRHHDPPTPIG